MANVWIVNPFDNLPEEGAKPQRYSLLAAEIARRGHGVVWWSSSFSHSRKARRADTSGAALPEAWGRGDGVLMRLVGTPPYDLVRRAGSPGARKEMVGVLEEVTRKSRAARGRSPAENPANIPVFNIRIK